MAEQARGRGFTLLEFIVVLGIVSILAVMAVPALMSIVPYAQLRGSARGVVSLMQQARLLAENTQKPARLALDCRPAGRPCRARLYTAVFNTDAGRTLKEWAEVPETSREMGAKVRVTAETAAPVQVAADNPANLFWVVFMPSGKLRTSHDPLKLIFSTTSPGSGSRSWELAVNRASGRATLKGLQ